MASQAFIMSSMSGVEGLDRIGEGDRLFKASLPFAAKAEAALFPKILPLSGGFLPTATDVTALNQRGDNHAYLYPASV